MGIGLSGINSGMDTDAIIEAMVMEKTEKKNSLVKAQKKLGMKQDLWKTLNNKIYSFYSKTLSNIRQAGSFNKKKVSISNPNMATVSAKSNSVNGTQSLAIQQLAKAGYLTGAKLGTTSGSKVSNSTLLSDLKSQSGGQGIQGETAINVTVGGKESVININQDTTVKDLVSQLSAAGVKASFDEANQRIFVYAKDSGRENDFSLTAADSKGIDALKALGLYTVSSKEVEQYQSWANYSASDISNLIEAAYKNKELTDPEAVRHAIEKEVESLHTAQKALKNTEVFLNEQKSYAQMYKTGTMESRAQYRKNLEDQAEEYKKKIADGDTSVQEDYDKINLRLSAIKDADAKLGSDTMTEEDREKELTAYLADVDSKIQTNNEKLTANQKELSEKEAIIATESSLQSYIDKTNADTHSRIENQMNAKKATADAYMNDYMKQNKYIYDNSVKDADGNAVDQKGNILVTKEQYEAAKAGLGGDVTISKAAYDAAVNRIGNIQASSNTDGNGAVRIEGEDAVIYLNGARYEGASNTITVNGLTITAQEVTGVDSNGKLNEISITTSTDTEGIYNMVKSFLKDYNALINEMDKLYNADSARGYEPLTDEEKKEMSDSEIELWENKIKDSLLRRDSSLGNIIQVMKNSMAGGVTINGKKSYLAEFGISTAGYLYADKNERGAYHIDGDEDDTISYAKADKLMKAIMEDPDHVAEVLSGVATNLYNNMTQAMRSTSLSSVYTAYNDKQMKKEYDNYTKQIKEQETKITWWEDYYRSKFTRMEKMLASLNSQQSSLAGLLGG